MSDIRAWFEAQLGAGRSAQPSPDGFPLATTVVADDQAPEAVRAARTFYRDACFDWGDAWIHRQPIGSRDVFFVHAGTDGDEGALEVFDGSGTLLDAAFVDGQHVEWEAREAVRARFER